MATEKDIEKFIADIKVELEDAFMEPEARARSEAMLKAAEKELRGLRKEAATVNPRPSESAVAAVASSPSATSSTTKVPKSIGQGGVPLAAKTSLMEQIERAEAMPMEAVDFLAQYLTARDQGQEATSVHYQLLISHGETLGLTRDSAQNATRRVEHDFGAVPFTWAVLDQCLLAVQDWAREKAEVWAHLGWPSHDRWMPTTEDDFDRYFVLKHVNLDTEEANVKAQYKRRMDLIASCRNHLKFYEDPLRVFIQQHAKPKTKYYDFSTARVQLSDYSGGIVQATDSLGEIQRQEWYASLTKAQQDALGLEFVPRWKPENNASTAKIKAELEKMRADKKQIPGGYIYQQPEKNRVSIHRGK